MVSLKDQSPNSSGFFSNAFVIFNIILCNPLSIHHQSIDHRLNMRFYTGLTRMSGIVSRMQRFSTTSKHTVAFGVNFWMSIPLSRFPRCTLHKRWKSRSHSPSFHLLTIEMYGNLLLKLFRYQRRTWKRRGDGKYFEDHATLTARHDRVLQSQACISTGWMLSPQISVSTWNRFKECYYFTR